MYPEDIQRLTGETPPDPPATYRIRTWDTYAQDFTPHEGIPEIVTGFRGLLMALRLLKEAGYDAHRNHHSSDPSVLIERINEEAAAFRKRLEEIDKEYPPLNLPHF